jgi:hypothetical protein
MAIRLFLAACLCAISLSTFAQTHLPSAATAGQGAIPVKDSAIFVFMPSEIVAIRAVDDIASIPMSFSIDKDSLPQITFHVPDGKMMVVTDIELPVLDKPLYIWFEQMVEGRDDLGWLLFDAAGVSTNSGNPNYKERLSTPLVFAPGKTYQLHSSNLQVGVTARGYFLEEPSSP